MRGSEVYISIETWRRLRAYAELRNLACVDAAAELLLSESLKDYPLIDELITEQDKSRKAIQEKWAALNKRTGSVSESV